MIKINKLTKLKERPCYDSWWLVETNLGTMKLHQYDNMHEEELKNQIEKCNTLEEIENLTPKHFYFD